MYFLIFLSTLVLYIFNKNIDFLYISALFAIASSCATIGIKLKEQNEIYVVEEIDQANIVDK